MSSGEIGLAILCAEHDMVKELLIVPVMVLALAVSPFQGLGSKFASTGALRHPAVVVSTLRAGGAFYLRRSGKMSCSNAHEITSPIVPGLRQLALEIPRN
jgi:hypothetical protein